MYLLILKTNHEIQNILDNTYNVRVVNLFYHLIDSDKKHPIINEMNVSNWSCYIIV